MQAEELKQTIDHELKMRDGTAKLLAACKGSSQNVEAAKNLLVSDIRLRICMEKLRQFKSDNIVRLPFKFCLINLILFPVCVDMHFFSCIL